MKKLAILFASMFIMAIAVQNVNAQNDATVNDAQASATIIETITLVNPTALRFGVLQPSGDSPENVEITPAGVINTNLTHFGSLHSQAIFNVTGAPNATYAISFANPTIVLEGSGVDMEVSSFVTDQVGNIGTMGSNGQHTFNVGATLLVGQGQAAGLYSGEYEVTVTYN